jgi:hypothetical protein
MFGSTRSRNRQWMLDDLDRLRALATCGTSTPLIAESLARTVSAIRHKAFRSGVRLLRRSKARTIAHFLRPSG